MNKEHFIERYYWQEIIPITDNRELAYRLEKSALYEYITVKVDPAIFGKLEYYPRTPVVNMNKKPVRGYNEVICDGNNITVFMTLWFTEQGYHAIVWDKEK